MTEKSLILMATYNGAEYIREQIESILSQTYRNWHLIIRDDGSKDNTLSILREYREKDPRIELLENGTSMHGAYSNFWALISEAKQREEYQYYFFSDQDDIWPDNRMCQMIYAAQEEKNETPILIYGDMEVIDNNSKLISKSLNSVMGIGKISGLTEFYSSGFVWGCNTMINRALLDRTPILTLDNPHLNIMSHDNYFAKFATVLGKVVYIDKCCIKHRRSGKNTTGDYHLSLTLRYVIKKAIKEYQSTAKVHALGYVQTLQTIDMMKKMDVATSQVLYVEKAIKAGGIAGVSIMIKQHVKRKQLSRTLGIYIIMLLGSYKKYMAEF